MAKTTQVALVLIALIVGVTGCNENAAYERMAETHRLAGALATEFARASSASDRAVMADTDDTASTFANEARAASDAVASTINSLSPILEGLSYSDESRLLKEFASRFADYRALDRDILALAVEGSNAKAQRLSFGAAQEAADSMRDAVGQLAPARPGDAWQVKALGAMALASARDIQVLHAPHIAEADEAAMTRLETRMIEAGAAAHEALVSLERVVAARSRPQLAVATAALDRLNTLNSEIRTLSRRNTNVRALALSLGQKRVLAALCESTLHALQEAIARRGLPVR